MEPTTSAPVVPAPLPVVAPKPAPAPAPATASEETFSLSRQVRSFEHAGRGAHLFVRTTHNARIQIICFGIAFILGISFQISHIEWMFLILCGGLVFAAEAFNTSIEIALDHVSPTEHDTVRDSKDVAAGAVLIAAVTSLILGFMIFAPYVIGVLY